MYSHLLFSPLAWGVLLTLLLALCWRWLGRALRMIGVAVLLALAMLCTPLGANALVWFVEARAPAQRRCGPADAAPIVVLSGGYERAPLAVDDYAALNPDSWRRLRGAVELWHRRAQGPLLIAGGGPYAVKESVLLAALARDWGVSADALRTETASTTTWQSAVSLRGALPARIRLVSSALHLPRALIAFDAAGFDACIHVSDSSFVPPGGWGAIIPQVSAAEKTETAVYELIGSVVYRVRAWREARDRDPDASTRER